MQAVHNLLERKLGWYANWRMVFVIVSLLTGSFLIHEIYVDNSLVKVPQVKAASVGYQARPSGYASIFHGVCDGVTTDVDSNGVADRELYVDASYGNDNNNG